MNQEIGLRVLAQIMNWTDDHARQEYAWLKLMARLKYDGYRDFQAGMRFIESLATWLQQFQERERPTAYAFIRKTLVYIGPGEMQHLVEQFYPRTVRDRLVQMVAAEQGVPTYCVLIDSSFRTAVQRLRRQTLFLGLSDGARIDTIRRANAGLLSNEQFVQGTQIDTEKWQDLLKNLRRDLSDDDARFRLAYLVDDFVGTGTSFLRRDKRTGEWKGKLLRFKESVRNANSDLDGDRIFAENWELCVHHYLASAAAVEAIEWRLQNATDVFGEAGPRAIDPSFGALLPQNLPIDAETSRHDEFLKLTERYYDPIIRNQHTDVGCVGHLGRGYGGCALPLVLEHNTPNNSVALLWAETDGGIRDGQPAPAMRPLFRRRERHT